MRIECAKQQQHKIIWKRTESETQEKKNLNISFCMLKAVKPACMQGIYNRFGFNEEKKKIKN